VTRVGTASQPVSRAENNIDFTNNQILVRAGKGDKDRHSMLPAAVKEPLAKHLDVIKRGKRT
jgi:hypothetical protein